MSPWTVRNILRRHSLTKSYKVRAYYRGKRVTVYYASSVLLCSDMGDLLSAIMIIMLKL